MANEQAIAEHSARDSVEAGLVPNLIPKGSKGLMLLVPDLPADSPFALVEVAEAGDLPGTDGTSGTLLGPFSPDEFVTDTATNATYTHGPTGTPIVLRCIKQHETTRGTWFDCIDDEGEPVTYFLQTVQENNLEIEDF